MLDGWEAAAAVYFYRETTRILKYTSIFSPMNRFTAWWATNKRFHWLYIVATSTACDKFNQTVQSNTPLPPVERYDWQPYPVDAQSSESDDHTHTLMGQTYWSTIVRFIRPFIMLIEIENGVCMTSCIDQHWFQPKTMQNCSHRYSKHTLPSIINRSDPPKKAIRNVLKLLKTVIMS